MKRHLDLRRDYRIQKAADAAARFVEVDYTFDEDESLPGLSEWIGHCGDFNIKIVAKSKESCETHMRTAVLSELIANQDKTYSILLKNKQVQFFL
jgi:hypothetical protein